MAITQTGAIYKAFSFDNVSSRNYGVYITSDAVYDAPERDVEMISIPGRNGALVLDNGRFENIEVKYPAGIFAENETDFAQAVSDLRNYLCSKKGYFRLTDEYNPNEYRMAVYKSGLEVSPVQLRAGEFEIIFDCKPQRYLTSGETEIIVNDGDTLTNPTQYDASPLLMVEGSGGIEFNGHIINIEPVTLGNIVLVGAKYPAQSVSFDDSLVNSSDPITLQSVNAPVYHDFNYLVSSAYAYGSNISKSNADCSGFNVTAYAEGISAYASFKVGKVYFTAGTAGSVIVSTDVYATLQNGTTAQNTHKLKIAYDGTDTISIEYAIDSGAYSGYIGGSFGETRAVSTVSALGNPTYIDCDIGECYMIKNDKIVSLNGVISLGSDLPTLASGNNEITFDNTITELKMIPRWWKL